LVSGERTSLRVPIINESPVVKSPQDFVGFSTFVGVSLNSPETRPKHPQPEKSSDRTNCFELNSTTDSPGSLSELRWKVNHPILTVPDGENDKKFAHEDKELLFIRKLRDAVTDQNNERLVWLEALRRRRLSAENKTCIGATSPQKHPLRWTSDTVPPPKPSISLGPSLSKSVNKRQEQSPAYLGPSCSSRHCTAAKLQPALLRSDERPTSMVVPKCSGGCRICCSKADAVLTRKLRSRLSDAEKKIDVLKKVS
jgi:hypothetical protein